MEAISAPTSSSGAEGQSSPPQGTSSLITHLPALDGVRGLAILLVIAGHTTDHLATQANWGTGLGHSLALSFGAGWIGVDLFFVLSGFLITRILLATKGTPRFFQSFYVRRALRILPLYLVFTAVLAVSIRTHQIYGSRRDVFSLLFYYSNIRQAFFGWQTMYAVPLWSLAVEEHFYLAWPLIIAFSPSEHMRKICIAGIAFSFGARVLALAHKLPVHAVYLLTPYRLDSLLIGAWLADAFRNPETWANVRRYARPVMALSAAALGLIAAFQGHFFDSVPVSDHPGLRHSSRLLLGPGLLLLAICFGALLVLSISGGPFCRYMQQVWLRQIGKYSYGMYVFHFWFMIRCRAVIARVAPQLVQHWTLEPFFFVAVVLLSFAMAFVSYELYEKRFLQLKRFFPPTPAAN